MFLTAVIKDEQASNVLLHSDSSFLLLNNMKTNTTSSKIIEIQLYANNLHRKFALFYTPYYLRHGIEIFSVYSLLQDITVQIWKLKKKEEKCRQIDFFKFYIKTGSAQQQ